MLILLLIHFFNLNANIPNDRLEEKLSDMECEDQILRQQALLVTPLKRMSEHLAITPIKVLTKSCLAGKCQFSFYSSITNLSVLGFYLQTLENGHHVKEEVRAKSVCSETNSLCITKYLVVLSVLGYFEAPVALP